MGLKSDIVIVSQYTVPLPGHGGKRSSLHSGSRGGTPGQYVLRYMARADAVETLAPIRRHEQAEFIERYMARDEAVETVDLEGGTPELKRTMRKGQGRGGVSFGTGSYSYSHERLKQSAKEIQNLFDQGHTVMNTIFSFDEEYLREHGLIPEDFQLKKAGDYRGYLDQMKLRMAISQGVERMARTRYDDLRWVGVIQVDTEHVHCHLSMVDAGRGRIHRDGTQIGKIDAVSKSLIRRGIDSFLDENEHIKHLSSAVSYERRNVTSYVKRWAHKQALNEALPQFLLATLPEDRRLWRASSNDPAMRKPNRVVRAIVEDLLARPDSPMPAALAKVESYADERTAAEGLSQKERDRLVATGRDMIVERGANSIYATLRQLPEDALQVRTPMLQAMGMDYEELVSLARTPDAQGQVRDGDDLLVFAYRLRSYTSRLDLHTEAREDDAARMRAWRQEHDAGRTAPSSQAWYDFYAEEEQYNAKLQSKYRHFLNFMPPESSWRPAWEKVSRRGEMLLSMQSMARDESLRKLSDPAEAEDRAKRIYGVFGGNLVAQNTPESKAELARRTDKLRQSYQDALAEFQAQLAAQGLRIEALEEEEDPENPARRRFVPTVTTGEEFDFEEVKALDLHHMRYDFARDVPVGKRSREHFIEQARVRREASEKVAEYLRASGQQALVPTLPLADIQAMNDLADSFEAGQTQLRSGVAELSRMKALTKRSKTVALGANIQQRFAQEFQRTVASFSPVDIDLRDKQVRPAVADDVSLDRG